MNPDFDLEASITAWRAGLHAHPGTAPIQVRELETHLRDSIDDLIQLGHPAEEAFMLASHRLGGVDVAEEWQQTGATTTPPSTRLSTHESTHNRRLSVLVMLSLLVSVVGLVLRVGIGSTPYEASDSSGRPMGFNDPLGAEHYLIIVGQFNVLDLLRPRHIHDIALLGMHVLGIWLLLNQRQTARLIRWFFALQPVIFPLGAVFFFVPFLFPFTLMQSWDRESFVDIPFMAMMCQPVWVVTSVFIMFKLRGDGLGIANVMIAASKALCAGANTFKAAFR